MLTSGLQSFLPSPPVPSAGDLQATRAPFTQQGPEHHLCFLAPDFQEGLGSVGGGRSLLFLEPEAAHCGLAKTHPWRMALNPDLVEDLWSTCSLSMLHLTQKRWRLVAFLPPRSSLLLPGPAQASLLLCLCHMARTGPHAGLYPLLSLTSILMCDSSHCPF